MQAQFNVDDYNLKVHIKEQFRQFVLQETNYIRQPPRKVDTKGALKKGKHIVQSMQHSPSLWENVESLDLDAQVSQSKSIGSSRKSASKSNMSPNPWQTRKL